MKEVLQHFIINLSLINGSSIKKHFSLTSYNLLLPIFYDFNITTCKFPHNIIF
jgi:hypothetical protein